LAKRFSQLCKRLLEVIPITATIPNWLMDHNGMTRGRFWMLVAVALFLAAAARFYSLGDVLGGRVFALVALVFVFRLFIEIRRRKRKATD